MKRMKAIILVAILFLGFFASVQGLAAGMVWPPEKIGVNQSIDQVGRFALHDGIPYSEVGSTGAGSGGVGSLPLCVRSSNDPQFEYMAASPYYKVFFKDTVMRMHVELGWIELGVPEQELGKIMNTASVVQENALSVSNVCEGLDLSYTVGTSVLKEAFTLKASKDLERIILEISWGGLIPEFQKDGSIVFFSGNEKVVKILPPFMEDAENTVCTDIHYEFVELETGYELHKVIDAKGLQWLKEAVYPVVIDPSMQVFADAWESSGLQPYGQYFQNLKEYVNPANGHLTVTQTDMVIPGRGLDLVISRTYETPAVFYQVEPYEYAQPPVNVGKGWHLNFPWIGTEYLHLQNGTMYRMEWSQDTFENHEGAHFVLVKNLDSTYTLTMANGTGYEFSTAGKLTEIRDLDQNTITFNYSSGILTSITDTIGRTVTFTCSDGRLQKIVYNGAEIEYGYSNGCLVWMDDFLNRRTSYSYNTGWYEWIETSPGCIQKENVYLLSKIEYPTGGYTTYAYDRFSYEAVYGDDGTCSDYFKYYVTHQKVYETAQVRHSAYAYTGTFSGITSCVTTVKNESDVTKGSYHFTVSNGLIYQQVTKNTSGTPIRKYTYTHNSKKECIQVDVCNDGSTLSYTNYYAYDNWGNCIYSKNAEGHEQFFSYANTDTSGFFIDNTGVVINQFTNAFTYSLVPESVHTVLLGTAEKQDNTYVKETYLTYDLKAHPTQSENAFGNATTWLTFSGTFNEKTGSTSFPIDLTGHTVTGNAVLQVTGVPSDDTYQENHSYGCPCNPTITCTWTGGSWSNNYYRVHWLWCAGLECDNGWASIGPFTHYPGTLGYQSYSTNPPMGGKAHTITVTTSWKAYPVQVEYNVDGSSWETVTSNLQNQTVQIPVTITGGSHTLYFSESSSKQTTFSWYLYVPVDNAPDTYTTTMQYDTYGNITSITDAESNTYSFTYSSAYSYAYLTEISVTVGTDTITTRASYDSARGWITSIQEPKGVDAGSGYDFLYTYDLLGRIVRKEFPLLLGQSQRSYLEAVYDDTNRTVTIIDPLRHYITQHFDSLGRLTDVKAYTGTYGSGTLYASESYTYLYNDLVSTVTDPGTDTFTYMYDFLGRTTQITYPGSVSVSYSYDDTNNKVTFTNGRNYHRIYWYDWLSRLEKVEEEYTTDLFAVTTYQYDEVGNLTSFTDAENHTTSFTYASFYGLSKVTYPDSEYEQYEYDSVGSVTMVTDCKGNNTTYTYDGLYRLTQIQYQDQSTVSFTYDLNCNRTKMEDDAPSKGDYSEYTYDCWNRLTTETRYISMSSYTVAREYDEAGRLTRLTYPDSMQILYSHDDLNRVTEITRYIDGVNDEILMDNVQYDTENLLMQCDYGNDLQAAYTYDSRDRPLTIDVTDGATSYVDLDYTWDANSNVTQVANGWRDTTYGWHSDTESYSYDGLDRLTYASCTLWSHTYAYDKVGNRTSKDSVTYTVNTVNEVTSLSDGTTFTYDATGNRTQKTKGTDTWVYTYDHANRLTKVEENSLLLGEYLYDGEGKRLQVTENSTTTYLYMGFDVLYEENTTGTAARIYSPQGVLARRTTTNGESHTFYYHLDHISSTRLATDENTNIVSTVTYHPFGEINTRVGSEDYLFTGKQKDSTGLSYYGARYYDPEVGRFLTRDPVKGQLTDPQTLNAYSYCLGNPLKYVDPDGRDPIFCDEKEDMSPLIHGSYVPQFIEARDPDEMMNEEGLILFWSIMIGMAGGPLVVAAICAAPAFFAWISAAAADYALLTSVTFFILGLITDRAFDQSQLNKLMEKMTPEECTKFFCCLQEYIDESGLDLKPETIIYNDDGTITVEFIDGSVQTFREVEGTWVPVPMNPSSGSSSSSSEHESSS